MKRFLICVLCIVTVFLTSCTSIDKRSNTISNTDAISGGVLNLYSAYPDTFNPLLTENWANSQILMTVYEGLYKVNPDKSVTGVLSSGYKTENGGKRYIIDLKQNVVFHNGTSFASDDVLYTLDCIREYESSYKNIFEYINSYTSNGDYQVVIDLEKPVADFVVFLDFPIISRDYALENESFFEISAKSLPCGTGPFMLLNDITQSGMTLEKNPAWHMEGPYTDKIEVLFMKDDNSTALYSFNACQIDIISSNEVNFGDFSFSNNMNIYEYAGHYYNFLAFNFENKAFSVDEIKQAISLSIDKQRLVNDVTHDHSYAVNLPINPDAYYNPSKFESLYDENKAKDILLKNNWMDLNSDGVIEKLVGEDLISLDLKLLALENDVQSSAAAKILEENIEKCGIKVEIDFKEGDAYYETLKNKEYDMALVRYEMPKNGDLTAMLSSESEKNYYNISSENIDKSLLNISNASDKEKLKEAYAAFADVFSNELVHIPLFFSSSAVYYQSYLKNYSYPSYNNIYNGISDIYIKY